MKTFQETVRMSHWRVLACAVSLSLLSPLQALAQNLIRSINTAQQSGADVVRIELAQPLTELPRGFTVQTPPRIALDLPGVAMAWAAVRWKSTRAICARPMWRSRVNAPVWC